MYSIGRCYASGHGVGRDVGVAREWLLRAAGAGSREAMALLGKLYAQRMCGWFCALHGLFGSALAVSGCLWGGRV
jgi:TPR repeat protein